VKQKGFTIIELMVVLGIIAILGAIALPQYNKYVTKTRVTEALHHAQVYARKYESEAAGGGDAGTIPTLEHATISITGSGADTRVNATLKDSIDSQVLIDSDDTAGGKILELGLIGSSGSTRWECKTNLSARLIPKVCAYKADVGGIADGTAWASLSDEDKASVTACWDQDYADGAGGGNGWVVGENTYPSDRQGDVREAAGFGAGTADYAEALAGCVSD
jgi:type IV pilus assembly protein PilA